MDIFIKWFLTILNKHHIEIENKQASTYIVFMTRHYILGLVELTHSTYMFPLYSSNTNLYILNTQPHGYILPYYYHSLQARTYTQDII